MHGIQTRQPTTSRIETVAIVGSRGWLSNEHRKTAPWTDEHRYHAVENTLRRLGIDPDRAVSGGATGADTAAEAWAEQAGVPIDVYPARWGVHGVTAGFLRNTDLLMEADAVVAFWDGQSPGTQDTRQKAIDEFDVELHTVRVNSARIPKFDLIEDPR